MAMKSRQKIYGDSAAQMIEAFLQVSNFLNYTLQWLVGFPETWRGSVLIAFYKVRKKKAINSFKTLFNRI